MKIISVILLSGCLVIFNSCQNAGPNSGEFNLLPQPQQINISGTSDLTPQDIKFYFGEEGNSLINLLNTHGKIMEAESESEAQLLLKIETSMDLKEEGYELEISNKKVSITAKDKAGLLYGIMTLEQLMTDALDQEVNLPLCTIQDYPLLSYRAIHLDLKHHREKTEYYYDLMDQLVRYKINAIIAEVEDKLAYEKHPRVGSADALSMEEWKKLSDYALARNIEISPLVQGLGHASFILKHEEYIDLRDDPESDWAFNPLDPNTYDLQFDLYGDAMEAMPHGRYLHVGGDEVNTTGRGSGQSELELQLGWLSKVCAYAEEHGRIPIFWDDMPIKYAGLYGTMSNTEYSSEEVDSMWVANEHKLLESLNLFPKNCIYMRWNYHSPQAEGNIKAMEWFSEHGLNVMGATAGQTQWELMPQNESNMENIRSFANTSADKAIEGLLLTLWDDSSPHFELYMRGILAFSEYSWTGDQRSKEEIKTSYRHREYGYTLSGEEYGFVDQLEQMVPWWNLSLLKIRYRDSLQKMSEPLDQGIIELPSPDRKGAWSENHADRLVAAAGVVRESKSIAATISRMKTGAVRNIYRLEVYEQVNRLVSFSAQALLALQTYDISETKEDEAKAMEEIMALEGEFDLLRKELENVYGETRILTKPKNYLLDQDHHSHLANQSISFDWQFVAEMFFLNKIDRNFPYD